MTARSHLNAFARSSRPALVAIALLLGVGPVARGQTTRAGGSIGVSLTILPPVASQPVRVVGFDVDRNGLATLRTTAPTSRAVSRIIMTSLTSGSSSDVAARPVATLAPSSDGATIRYVVDLGRTSDAEARQPVQLRLRYLTVAGT